MAWQLVGQPAPLVKFLTQGGKVRWNDATQRMLGYPFRVDCLHDSEQNQIGFRAGGQYIVGYADDELSYQIIIPDALEAIGLELEADYEVEPQLIDHSEGEISGMVGAISMALPGEEE